jgi:hypothetical protein
LQKKAEGEADATTVDLLLQLNSKNQSLLEKKEKEHAKSQANLMAMISSMTEKMENFQNLLSQMKSEHEEDSDNSVESTKPNIKRKRKKKRKAKLIEFKAAVHYIYNFIYIIVEQVYDRLWMTLPI